MPKTFVALAIIAGVAAGCAKNPGPAATASGPLRVVATTGMVADSVRRVLGPEAEVTALMGPGVDPHLYKASEGDARRLGEADLIVVNGLHLEGKLSDLLLKLARSRPVIAITEGLAADRLREPPELQGAYDPHVWFDLSLWRDTVDPIARVGCELRPASCTDFQARAEAWKAELEVLDREVTEAVAQVPESARVLVTAHDAFGYFGARYGFEVVGLQGLSTATEAGLQDVERVASLVAERGIRAIFVETSVAPRALEAVQAAVRSRGHEVVIGGSLFSDAMGPEGTPEGEFPGMVRANVRTIVEALR